jgi:hypothetical protein
MHRSWIDFIDEHPAAHLVVGVSEATRGAQIAGRRHLLCRLIAKLEPEGDFSMAVVRGHGAIEIHCGFEKKTDADRLADALRATVIDRYQGHLTQRAFRFDDTTCKAIEEALRVQDQVDAETMRSAAAS